jgi:hypothetical protein
MTNAPSARAGGRQAQLRRVLGCDAHQRIVDEMARFA